MRFNTAKQVELAAAGVEELTILDVYDDSEAAPTSANQAATGVLLVSITGVTWNQTANPAVVTGTPGASAVASGTPAYGRFRNAGDTKRMDGDVGEDFTLSEATITENGTVTLLSGGLTQPSGEV